MRVSKKLITRVIIFGVLAFVIFSIFGGSNRDVDISVDNSQVPLSAIHYHPMLTIIIDGEIEPIASGIGGHAPIHTHDSIGTLHMENNDPQSIPESVTLGYFFKQWGKFLSSECIFDHCTDSGTLTMHVNGIRNSEFQNYIMHDDEEIVLEYTSND